MRLPVLLLISAFFILPVNSQQTDESINRIKAAKVKFFNEKLELSKEEAQEFWPIYNDYDNRRRRIIQERRNLMSYYTENMQNLDEKEVSEILEKYMTLEERETKLLLTYNEKFKQVIPEKKVIKVYLAEVQFKKYLLNQLRTKKPRMAPRN